MELADAQGLMVRLLTDPAELDRFLAVDAGTGSHAGFEGLDPSALARFASSLLAKRRGEVAKILPRTVKALGRARFLELFREHAAAAPTEGTKRHRDDAIAFADSLRPAGVSRWISDLARLEAFPLVLHQPGARWNALRLAFRPRDLMAWESLPDQRPRTRPTLLIAFRGRVFQIPW